MSGEILTSGWRAEDTAAIHRLYNKLVAAVVGKELSKPVLSRRLRMLSGWLLETAEELDGISAEDAAALDVERFWKARAAGNRGNDPE